MIYLTSDHGGKNLAKVIEKFLRGRKIEYKYLSQGKNFRDDDYPDFAIQAAKLVAKNPAANLGILICRSGQGMCIAANKVRGIRASLCWNIEVARASRIDDMANILCLPADYITNFVAEQIVQVWLQTRYSFIERHARRVKKISSFENKDLESWTT